MAIPSPAYSFLLVDGGLASDPCHHVQGMSLLTDSPPGWRRQVSDDANVMLNGFGTVVNSLKMRAKPYLPQICGTIKWRLNNKSAKIRQQAADLIARIAIVMKVGLTLRMCVWYSVISAFCRCMGMMTNVSSKAQ